MTTNRGHMTALDRLLAGLEAVALALLSNPLVVVALGVLFGLRVVWLFNH